MTESKTSTPAESDEQSAPVADGPKKKVSTRVLRQREQRKRTVTLVLLTVFLVVALLLTGWPWPRHFLSGLATGAEAPRDAWKLAWGAQYVLEGHVLPGHNAPGFYPHAGVLDFDDPLYVPSLVAVVPFSATDNAVFAYNVTLLVFWVLSGLMMYLFLRELGIGRTGCVFGAIAFVLVPCRTALLHDLGAQLCFGVPLCLMLLTRWVRLQQRRWALLLGLALAVQALSSLGYALALTAALPLVALVALVRRRPSPFYERSLYDGIALMVLVPLVLAAVFLGPAVEVRSSAALASAYEQRDIGAVEPVTYVNPNTGSLVDAISLSSNTQTTSLFPGVAVLVLACVYGFFHRQMLRKQIKGRRVRQALINVLSLARIALCICLGAVFIGRATAPDSALWANLGQWAGSGLIALVGLTFASGLVAWRHPRAFGMALLHGLGFAALVCFIMSLGPRITTGSALIPVCDGPLPGPQTLHAFLGTVGPLSRFGIVPIVFLIAAAAWILDEVAHHRRFWWVPIPALVLVCAESVVLPNSFESVASSDSTVIERLKAETQPHTLLAVPAGDPETDARALLRSVGKFHLMINGTATVRPADYEALIETFAQGDTRTGSRMLKELWPDPLLLVDKEAIEELPDPYVFSENALVKEWDKVAEDDRYVLYKPAANAALPFVVRKRVRADIAGQRLRLHLQARTRFSNRSLEPHILVDWNGMGEQSYALTSDYQPLLFEGRARWVGRPEGDVVTISLVFKAEDGETFTPAAEALAGQDTQDAWQVVEIEFWEAPRR